MVNDELRRWGLFFVQKISFTIFCGNLVKKTNVKISKGLKKMRVFFKNDLTFC
ncbi:hypothetical protein FEDK69T_18820 [Flavobacterium enshiense DK69]|nr:hypothetical protein FEDK69T_18820 [Flavobacterium enshiense DK69]